MGVGKWFEGWDGEVWSEGTRLLYRALNRSGRDYEESMPGGWGYTSGTYRVREDGLDLTRGDTR